MKTRINTDNYINSDGFRAGRSAGAQMVRRKSLPINSPKIPFSCRSSDKTQLIRNITDYYAGYNQAYLEAQQQAPISQDVLAQFIDLLNQTIVSAIVPVPSYQSQNKIYNNGVFAAQAAIRANTIPIDRPKVPFTCRSLNNADLKINIREYYRGYNDAYRAVGQAAPILDENLEIFLANLKRKHTQLGSPISEVPNHSPHASSFTAVQNETNDQNIATQNDNAIVTQNVNTIATQNENALLVNLQKMIDTAQQFNFALDLPNLLDENLLMKPGSITTSFDATGDKNSNTISSSTAEASEDNQTYLKYFA